MISKYIKAPNISKVQTCFGHLSQEEAATVWWTAPHLYIYKKKQTPTHKNKNKTKENNLFDALCHSSHPPSVGASRATLQTKIPCLGPSSTSTRAAPRPDAWAGPAALHHMTVHGGDRSLGLFGRGKPERRAGELANELASCRSGHGGVLQKTWVWKWVGERWSEVLEGSAQLGMSAIISGWRCTNGVKSHQLLGDEDLHTAVSSTYLLCSLPPCISLHPNQVTSKSWSEAANLVFPSPSVGNWLLA